ncbi:dethiobiotin synthase [Erwinia tracheiphila]|uniref:ATP-dependent dethiobiotin synthetase BioD n=1 Tax=Erwinia tracheiphila TaxID=65700 RepID=A0A345CS99_9GAMM|nr:dethiobiotin synthase [Erwinia tracheiphila]AXF76316.1 ATP-dependent dethiobiotin synthetase BioD [Erwinia tracheiphila]UIA85026.1 dethiobiotin synthase [Erwinia tracheiphila]UIA93623.1 dethiobiotin synthase [Erwinia tracheiphila]
MTKRWFITGTDTEVGKTVASQALLQAARAAGFCAVGYKPVASGCEMTPEGLRNGDALALQRNSALLLPYDDINPLAFSEPTSPHIVSEVEQRPILFSQLSAGLTKLTRQADWVLTEGAGGWFTPLSARASFADWVVQEQLPVVLVVGIRLGCINHAMLTARAIEASGLRLAGWIANGVQPAGRRHAEYLAWLRQHLMAPMLGEIPHLIDPADLDRLGQYLSLPE